MHIKTGSWEVASSVCDSDALCDPAVLVSAANSEPQIRNRRLSPGSGSGGGGGGGCISENRQNTPENARQNAPESPGHPPAPRLSSPDIPAAAARKDKERKGHKGRSSRRDGHRGARERRASQKERWVEDSLTLLKPPPAFPVQDSPAKLQPAVSYASKVKSGGATGLEDERPAIGVLLQNQWGLSFISEARPASDSSSESPPPKEEAPPTDAAPPPLRPPQDDDENNGKLLLSCRHLVEALSYHSREWSGLSCRDDKDPSRVVWYNSLQDEPE